MAIRAILLDTNAYTAFKRNLEESAKILSHSPVIGINTVVLGELLCGFALGKYESLNKKELNLFLSCSRVKILSINNQQ
jgi:predicted nucleic acid-binding protein